MGGLDISDLHRRGGNFIDLLDAAKAAATEDEFESGLELARGEREERLEQAKHMLEFGVAFLDKALGGIALNDLIIIGAKTGLGKTELASLITTTNTVQGRTVHYFALEGERREIERRTKYKILSRLVSENCSSTARRRMNYLEWRYGRLEDITGPFEDAAFEMLQPMLRTLRTYYRRSNFEVQHLEAHIRKIADATDLIVIDHLHYIDSSDPNENRGYKEIVKTVRSVALEIGKPVIILAHVRKGDRRGEPLVPILEDFHGSSDVPKIATKAIMIANARLNPNNVSYLVNTYIRAVKCRPDGQRTRYCGLVPYNLRLGGYERAFQLGELRNNDSEWEPLHGLKYPVWAEEFAPPPPREGWDVRRDD